MEAMTTLATEDYVDPEVFFVKKISIDIKGPIFVVNVPDKYISKIYYMCFPGSTSYCTGHDVNPYFSGIGAYDYLTNTDTFESEYYQKASQISLDTDEVNSYVKCATCMKLIKILVKYYDSSLNPVLSHDKYPEFMRPYVLLMNEFIINGLKNKKFNIYRISTIKHLSDEEPTSKYTHIQIDFNDTLAETEDVDEEYCDYYMNDENYQFYLRVFELWCEGYDQSEYNFIKTKAYQVIDLFDVPETTNKLEDKHRNALEILAESSDMLNHLILEVKKKGHEDYIHHPLMKTGFLKIITNKRLFNVSKSNIIRELSKSSALYASFKDIETDSKKCIKVYVDMLSVEKYKKIVRELSDSSIEKIIQKLGEKAFQRSSLLLTHPLFLSNSFYLNPTLRKFQATTSLTASPTVSEAAGGEATGGEAASGEAVGDIIGGVAGSGGGSEVIKKSWKPVIIKQIHKNIKRMEIDEFLKFSSTCHKIVCVSGNGTRVFLIDMPKEAEEFIKYPKTWSYKIGDIIKLNGMEVKAISKLPSEWCGNTEALYKKSVFLACNVVETPFGMGMHSAFVKDEYHSLKRAFGTLEKTRKFKVIESDMLCKGIGTMGVINFRCLTKDGIQMEVSVNFE
jgi:hypothetical protein